MTTASVPAAQAGARFNWRQPIIYVVALTAILVSIIPVLYIWISGFRTSADLNAAPGGWPNPWFLGNYANVLSSPRFWGSVFSSSLVAVGTTVGVVVLGLCAAYVIARYQFRGRQGLYTFFSAGLIALATNSMSPRLQRARPQMVAPRTVWAIRRTDSKSPGDAIGNPASMTSTPRSTSACATSSFSSRFMLQPGDCSPSRSVVSKMWTRFASGTSFEL